MGGMFRLMRFLWFGAFFAVTSSVAGAQTPVVATPLRSKTPRFRLPRVSGMSDKGIERRVNALLAQKQSEYVKELRDCRRPDLPGPSGDDAKMRVAYLSDNLLSLDVRVTVVMCAPYPQIDMAKPFTIDLRSGAEVVLNDFFQSDFLYSVVPKLYLSRYQTVGMNHTANDECLNELRKEKPLYIWWLDRKRGGLVVEPDVPHVMQACADEEVISWAELATYLRNEKIAGEFRKLALR